MISCLALCGWNSRALLNILIIFIVLLNNVTGSGGGGLSFLAFLALLLGGPCVMKCQPRNREQVSSS